MEFLHESRYHTVHRHADNHFNHYATPGLHKNSGKVLKKKTGWVKVKGEKIKENSFLFRLSLK